MSIKLFTRNGIECIVPETEYEDNTQKFFLNDNFSDINNYYLDNGFVILRSVLNKESCNDFLESWDKEVKNYKGFIYRQTNAKLEENIFNDKNWVMNPILNMQSLDKKKFNNLRRNFEKKIVDNAELSYLIGSIINDKPMIVQSMYFEGNSVTWEHQDSYYLDDEEPGKMIAGWLALEDIEAKAGRFFVCPKSHLNDYSKMNLENLITKNHKAYIDSIVKIIKQNKYEVIAPKLNKGDLLLWNSLTIHGSLDSQSLKNSRSSITFHIIRSNYKFRVFRNVLRNLNPEQKSAFNIFRPKDMAKKRNKIMFYFELNFPKLFHKIKSISVNLITSINS